MELIDLRVEWNLRWSNDPTLQLLVRNVPNLKDLRYEQKDTLYFAEKDGYASFYSYSSPGQGYGGRHFPITMVDGSEEVLVGPWSSRSACMNKAGFNPCLEVSFTEEADVWGRGHTFYGAAVTAEWLLGEMQRLGKWPHLEVRPVQEGDTKWQGPTHHIDEPHFVVVLKGLTPDSSKDVVKSILKDSLEDEGARERAIAQFGGFGRYNRLQEEHRQLQAAMRRLSYESMMIDKADAEGIEDSMPEDYDESNLTAHEVNPGYYR